MKIIIRLFLILSVWDIRIPIIMKITVMQLHITEAQIITQGIHMHFPDTLGIISCFCQFSRHS